MAEIEQALEEAPSECIAVHSGEGGAPSPAFVVCDTATSPGRRRAIKDPVNALALAAPRLLPVTTPRALNGNLAARDEASFKARFEELTAGTFRNWSASDWENVVVAGGAVVACLSCEANTSPNTDVDVFLYGMDDAAARAKIERIFDKLKSESKDALALRTPHTVTVVLPYPKRIVQIVLNLHATAAEVVDAFDVDICGAYWDGSKAYATRRCARAFATRVNVAVPSRRSTTYETRLIKYAKRGFAIGVPGLRKDDVQLKERVPVRKCAFELPPDHPKYAAKGEGDYSGDAWKRVDVGFELKFVGGEGWGEAADMPGMDDYFNAQGCRKLLIADMAGRSQFKREGRRTKFVVNARDTMAIAEYLMATEDPYGPSLPDVPNANIYTVRPKMTDLTGAPAASRHAVKFVNGPIKTGAAAGFDEATWFDKCYISTE
mmetsp:Transcript_35135/g.108863  ORF Transcript_35135/g.108863 Transcript_35135/m.108863 type:complete len:434 (-) Transcript_35135:64-1365(-)